MKNIERNIGFKKSLILSLLRTFFSSDIKLIDSFFDDIIVVVNMVILDKSNKNINVYMSFYDIKKKEYIFFSALNHVKKKKHYVRQFLAQHLSNKMKYIPDITFYLDISRNELG